MNFPNKARLKFPILLSIAVTFLFFGILSYSGYIIKYIPWALEGSEYRYQLCGEIIAALVAIGAVLIFGCGYVLRRKGCGFFKGLIPAIYILATVAYTGIIQFQSSITMEYSFAPLSEIIVFLLTMVMVGFTEELIFRGFIAEIIFRKYSSSPAQVWFSVIISGMLFGFMHMINAFSVGNTASALIQSITASVIGMAFCAIYYRTKNLWVCIFLHTVINTASLLPTGIFTGYSFGEALGSYTSFNLLGAIPYAIITAVLLRPEKMREIIPLAKPSSLKHIIINTLLATALFITAIITAYVLLPETVNTLTETIKESIQSA